MEAQGARRKLKAGGGPAGVEADRRDALPPHWRRAQAGRRMFLTHAATGHPERSPSRNQPTGPVLSRSDLVLLDSVRGLAWPARRRVSGTLSGTHLSRLRGRAPELSEYRLYRQGDDPRLLDWKLLARSDRAFVRLADDHAVHPTWFVVDASASMAFPAPTMAKWEAARALTIGLAAVAQRAGDPVGALVVGSGGTARVAARSRPDVLLQLAASLSSVRPGGAAALAPALVHIPERARLVLLTDLLGDEDALRRAAAARASAGGDVHCFHVVARDELSLPDDVRVAVDPEHPDLVRPLDDVTRAAYHRRFAEWREDVSRTWRLGGIAYRQVVAEEDPTRLVRAIAAAAREPAGA
jgi:uncharacterized protein (DUF58 family)